MKPRPEDHCDGHAADHYGEDYLTWKSWGGAAFGTLSHYDFCYYSAEIARTKSAIPTNAKVLEIGFGNGSFLEFAKRKGWDACGTEVNEHLVDIARTSGFTVMCTDALSSFPDKAFDLVVAFDVLEHMPPHRLLDFVAGVKRILKAGGCFIARFPNGDSPFGLVNQNGDITHVEAIGSLKCQYLASKAGMDVIFIGGAAQPLTGLGTRHFFRGAINYVIRKTIELFVREVFFSGRKIAFCSSNLTFICGVKNS